MVDFSIAYSLARKRIVGTPLRRLMVVIDGPTALSCDDPISAVRGRFVALNEKELTFSSVLTEGQDRPVIV